MLVVKSRDIYFYAFSTVLEDNSIMVTVFDTGEPEPKGRTDLVRMTMPLMGLHIIPDPVSPEEKCMLKMTMEFDLKGNIPNWINKIILRDESWQLVKLRKLYKAWEEKYGERNKQEGIIC